MRRTVGRLEMRANTRPGGAAARAAGRMRRTEGQLPLCRGELKRVEGVLGEGLHEIILRTCALNGVDPEGLVLHSDNGGPMKGSTMLATLQRLGIVPSFSRPRVSDDNAFSEALFRTLKYRPGYPVNGFDSMTAAIEWVEKFVAWYNSEHRHSGIKFVTPDERHFGREQKILKARVAVYERARAARPERWSRATRDWSPEGPVRLNPPARTARTPTASEAKAA